MKVTKLFLELSCEESCSSASQALFPKGRHVREGCTSCPTEVVMYYIRRTGILLCFSLSYLAAPSVAHCVSSLLLCLWSIVALSHTIQMFLQERKLLPSSNCFMKHFSSAQWRKMWLKLVIKCLLLSTSYIIKYMLSILYIMYYRSFHPLNKPFNSP